MKNKKELSTVLLSCNEVAIYYKRPIVSSMKLITHAKDAVDLIRKYHNFFSLDVKEYFWLISLSTGNRVLGVSTISIGTVNGTLVNIKEILQIALLTHATGIILVHNHPSGNLKFSESDIHITKRIYKCCDLFDIKLLDHIVITSESFVSMCNAGTTPFI
jgi:DNA repair protein RadC